MASTTPRVVIDPWSFYNFKEQFEGINKHQNPKTAPMAPSSWVGEHWRRLLAYMLLESYYRNNAKEWMRADTPDDIRQNRREYGDAKTIRDAILSSLLGDDISIMVVGAESDRAEERDAVAEALNDLFRTWRTKERLDQKVVENERNAVGLGDGVYVLTWDQAKRRPRLSVYDPGFYFPVLSDDVVDEYPDTVHLAWEFEQEESTGTKKFVRRLTWELAPIEPHDAESEPVPDSEGDTAVLFDNETQDVDGQILRAYPWNPDPSPLTCFFTDATWLLADTRGTIQDLNPAKAAINTPRIDLQMDFVPVVHMPNTVAGAEHFGVSCIAQVMQILDDLVSDDTDLQASSALTGTPPIAITGSSVPRNGDGTITSYGPGTVWETGDGNATMIDTSSSLDALLKYKDSLQERLATNSRVPESLLGKVKPNEVPSGIALTLSFLPHSSLIKEMRMVRADKNGLLLKFVGRMFWYNDLLTVPAGQDLPEANIVYGSFLPADRQEVVSLISTLLGTNPPAISLETAVEMLMRAGFPIEDAIQEIQRIQDRDFGGADALLNATGDVGAAREYLGMPALLPSPPAPPAPPGPPAPPPGG